MIPAANREKILRELGTEALAKARAAKDTRRVETDRVVEHRSKAGGSDVAVVQIVESPGGTREQYEQVIQEIGMTGSRLAPGQLVHFAGPLGDDWGEVNIWESQEAADKWFSEKVKPAREKLGMSDTQPKSLPVHRLVK